MEIVNLKGSMKIIHLEKYKQLFKSEKDFIKFVKKLKEKIDDSPTGITAIMAEDKTLCYCLSNTLVIKALAILTVDRIINPISEKEGE